MTPQRPFTEKEEREECIEVGVCVCVRVCDRERERNGGRGVG